MIIKKIILAATISFCTLISFTPDKHLNGPDKNFPTLLPSQTDEALVTKWVDSLYAKMNLAGIGLKKETFFDACKGYEYLLSKGSLKKQNLLTICDLSQSSSKKRLYVLDLLEGKILYNTYVAHGRNSGAEYATSFSNSADSYKSSLGFMITEDTYNGNNGYSMRFNGIEKGFNTNVKDRAIVMHGSDYVSSNRIASGQYTGRSFGCPAVPQEMHKKIIDCIKNGSCFFSYYPNNIYTKTSHIINASFNWPVAKTLNTTPLNQDSVNYTTNNIWQNTIVELQSPAL